jgi:hypothetical protein
MSLIRSEITTIDDGPLTNFWPLAGAEHSLLPSGQPRRMTDAVTLPVRYRRQIQWFVIDQPSYQLDHFRNSSDGYIDADSKVTQRGSYTCTSQQLSNNTVNAHVIYALRDS